MPITPWKILESTYLRNRIRLDKCELADGKVFEPMVFEFRTWGNVLALTRDQRAILIKQYRHGAQTILWELPGGVIEDGEEPLLGIQRELREETGYTTNNFVQVARLYPNPANQTNFVYSFLALDVEQVAEQYLDAAEEIEVHLVPLEELIAMTQRGEFQHALMVATLYHAFMHLRRLK